MKKSIASLLLTLLVFLGSAQIVDQQKNILLKALAKQLDSAHQVQQAEITAYLGTEAGRREKNANISAFSPTGRPLYTIEHNSGAALSSKTTELHRGGRLALDLSGDGMIVGIWEIGSPDPGHIEFEGRVIVKDQADEIRDHASHVTGTVLAAGINVEAKGMAYEATGHLYSASGYLGEAAFAASEGLLVSSHSYGKSAGWHDGEWLGDPQISSVEDWKFGIYNSEAATLDQIAYLAPHYLLIRSAGNERGESGTGGFPSDGPFDSMTGEAIAKNILTVGNANPLAAIPGSAAELTLSGSSSWGPTDDGRVKPDLVAAGVSILSTSIDASNAYDRKSGTSMSTPVVAGNSILLQQLYHQLYGQYTLAATLKGLLLHTALDGGQEGPDYSYGHGFLDASLAARTITEVGVSASIEETELMEGETYLTTFQVSDPTKPLIVSISWTDPSGTPIDDAVLDPSDIKLVNDLNLRVISPEGGGHLPWILDPSDPGKAATTGVNFRDNYEKVEIQTPEVGTYTIEVKHQGTLTTGTQTLSVIASNMSRHDDRATYYWIGGSGSWDDPQNWSDQSAGIGIGSVPNAMDRVVFDQNSFSSANTISLGGDVNAYALGWFPDTDAKINFSGHTLTVSQSAVLSASITAAAGIFKLNPGTGNGSLIVDGANQSLEVDLTSPDHTLILSGDELVLEKLSLQSGSLVVLDDIDSEKILLSSEVSTNAKLDNLNITTSQLELGDTSLNRFSIENSSIVFVQNIGNSRLISDGYFDLPDVSIESGQLEVLRSGFIASLQLQGGSGLLLANEVQLEIEKMTNSSSEAGRTTIATTTGKAEIVSNSNSKFCLDFFDIENVDVSGNSKFVYERNSTLTNGDGWIGAQCQEVLFANFDFLSPCAGNTTFFEDLSDGTPDTWSWDFGDGGTSSDQNPKHSYSTIGDFEVTLTVAEGNETSSFKQVIEVIDSDIQKPVVSSQGGRLLTNSPGQTFRWFFNGELIAGETNRLLAGTPSFGAYEVEVSNGQCIALSDPYLVLGNKDKLNANFKVLGNPVRAGTFQVSSTKAYDQLYWQLVSIDGRMQVEVRQSVSPQNPLLMSVPQGITGVYILIARKQDQVLWQEKVIINR
ncbi:MAG: S8 family serine peptidase [Cyclobacteriaceae bacterium]|nr:S8 family serine peptidase [Cyclobacteriaceae bacterium HetDA_MAG_MS6]